MIYLRFDTACDNDLQLQEMHDFTIRSAYSSLPCTTMEQSFASQQGNAQNNKKKKKRQRTGSLKVLPNVKTGVYDNNTWKFETNENNGVRTGNILNRSDSVRSSCSSGSESFGSESTFRHKPSSDGIFSSMPPFSHQIILVHDPVVISNDDRSGSGKYNGICSQLSQFQHPVVLVLSQAGERDGVHWAINDLIPIEIQARYVEFSGVYVTVDMIFS